MEKKKLLEVCNFSSGADGVWTRVLEEAKRFSKDYDVYVFSSDSSQMGHVSVPEEKIGDVKIKRFPSKFRMGYATWFDFKKDAIKLNPDIIIAHGFRNPHLNKVIKIKKKTKSKIFLVTHAPFVEKKLRNWKLNSVIWMYDKFYAKKVLNSFNKIFAISRWEIPFLLKKGADKNKIVVIHNGVDKEMFSIKRKVPVQKGRILFFGRLDPIKDVEILIRAVSRLKQDYVLDITGPGDKNYIDKLKGLASSLNVKVEFNPAVYNLEDKIKKIDSAEIFVLPSKSETLGIVLIEAMAREKVCIASTAKGPTELMDNQKNGFLFKIGDSEELSEKISFCFENRNSKEIERMKKNAKEFAKSLTWDELIDKMKKEIEG
jgi:glycosyltransferase involved in cell wall biosynthesis